MSPRPRTIPDADVLAATARVVARLGPHRMTLADVAAEVGLAPATLVQRFGSRRGLLLAFARSALEGDRDRVVEVRARHPSPLDAIVAIATGLARTVETPAEMANHVAFLHLDLSDPDFRAVMIELSRRTLAAYRALLDEAVAAGELAPCDTARLAHAVSAVSGGSMISWAVLEQGTASAFVRADLETLLAPYRVTPARPSTRPRGTRPAPRRRRRPAGA